MKRFFALVISFCLLLLLAGSCMASSWRIMNGDETIEKGQVVAGDVLFSGERLEVDGEIKGDLLVWSGAVIINGRIDGSILGVAWDQLIINGQVLGSIRGFANQIKIGGRINGSITAFAASIVTSRQSLIGRGLLGTFSNVNLRGTINDSVYLKSAPETRIGGRINGDLQVQGVPPTWQAPLEIAGKVNDYSGVAGNPAKTKGIDIRGGYQLHQPQHDSLVPPGIITLISIVWFIGSLLASLILFRLFPKTLWQITEPSHYNFRRSIVLGLISLIGIPIVIVILIFTMVGIPLAILLGLIYLILLLFFGIPVNLWFGRLIFRSRFHPSLMIVMAGILMVLISLIPIINMAFMLIFLLMGTGMIVGNIRLQIFERQKLDLKL
jgi:cytoskeletal protein CcmA (bactofilin family)